MALVKCKVLEADIDKDGCISIPEKSTAITANYRPLTGTPFLVLIMKYDDWAVDFLDEAKKEAELGALIHNAEAIRDNREKGVPNVE